MASTAHADTFFLSATFSTSGFGQQPVELAGFVTNDDSSAPIHGNLYLSSLPPLPQDPNVARGYWSSSVLAFSYSPPTAGSWVLQGGVAWYGNAVNLVIAGNLQGYEGGPILSGYVLAGYEQCARNDCGSGFLAFPLISGSLTYIEGTTLNTPLPATMPLFASGLGLLGWLIGRQKNAS